MVLDDTLHVAKNAADWDSLGAEVTLFDTIVDETDTLLARLEPFDY